MLVRAVARPRHRLRDAMMCCRATHAARRVSSIIESKHSLGEQVVLRPMLGGRAGANGTAVYVRVLSSPVGLFVSSNLATRLGRGVKTSAFPAR